MAHWDGAQGQAKMAKITQNTPTCDIPPRKAQTQNEKKIFYLQFKTCWIRRWFEQFSSSIAWQVIGLQSSARKVGHMGLKGSKQQL